MLSVCRVRKPSGVVNNHDPSLSQAGTKLEIASISHGSHLWPRPRLISSVVEWGDPALVNWIGLDHFQSRLEMMNRFGRSCTRGRNDVPGSMEVRFKEGSFSKRQSLPVSLPSVCIVYRT
jgi:hypothetical protein